MNTATHSTPILLPSDSICAKVIYRGTNILSLNLSGITSMAQLYKAIISATHQIRGMVTLSLRNLNQGWNISRPLLISPL
ncbi:MAG: hypothetical protein K2L69_06995 [Muribaculaceae bacterium]|nr:hypothetical protein [Muribaculaceae bacterium]MDE5935298.1 hypothetical protein [Muribaculaceae bacterium]MDE6093808.1 hypothetical protein [Muribaculaceae bacterium]MDE6344469.1 hypothetical protein [Muribaculaceae bacterium]MDE6610468.1 hypothetical protein [Muribaculaceae bacterium]